MASATNRNLQAKHTKAKRQARELAHLEMTKAPYLAVSKAAMREEGETIRRLMQHI